MCLTRHNPLASCLKVPTCVIVLRSPTEVAANLESAHVNSETSVQSWMAYNKAALSACRAR